MWHAHGGRSQKYALISIGRKRSFGPRRKHLPPATPTLKMFSPANVVFTISDLIRAWSDFEGGARCQPFEGECA